MPDLMNTLDYWGARHDRLLAQFHALQKTALELRGEIRALNFKVSTLEQATGADSAQVIGELRMKLARREESLRSLVKYYDGTAPYKAPEVMEGFLRAYTELIAELLDSWEEEDAAATQVSGDEEGSPSQATDSGTSGCPGGDASGASSGHECAVSG